MIIRFPPYKDLRGPMPMASRLSLWDRLFGRKKHANVAKIRIARARRGHGSSR